MACSGLTNATITLPLPVAEFISFPASPPGRAGSDRPGDAVLTGAMPSACLAVASVVVIHFSELLQKKPCGMTGGRGTVGLVEMNGNGEWVPPAPFRDGTGMLAPQGSWPHKHTSFSFPLLLKTLQAALKNAHFFNSKHLTSFKSCGLHKSHVAAWQVCQFTANKIYLMPDQKQPCPSKPSSHLICKGVFKDFIISSLSVNGLWAIFQLIYTHFIKGSHTNNNRSKKMYSSCFKYFCIVLVISSALL